MSWLERRSALIVALVSSGCGRVGIDLLDLSAALQDGGAEQDEAGAVAGPPGARDDAAVVQDASASLDGAADAQTLACTPGFANCDSDPLSCETQLGSVAHCASCGDVCPANGGTAVCSAGSCGTVCNMTGTLALKITVAVSWPAGAVSAGTGSASIWARFTGTQSGNNLVGSLEPCGFGLPDFVLNPLVGSERYQFSFPNTLFDHVPAYIPTTAATFSSASGFRLGAGVSLPTVGIQVGSALSNPASDAWTDVASISAPDTDADGKPGVTGIYSSAAGYALPRTNGTGSSRADRSYAAARFAFGATGSVSSCSELSATASFNSFDTHLVGCRISGGADCTTAQRDLLDSGRPLFVPASASLRALKIAAGATCAAVRAALP